MDVKEAVKTAKQYIDKMFADEGIKNVGLEEVVFDDNEHSWKITIGFSRTWDEGIAAAMKAAGGNGRSYKIVCIDDNSGRVVSLTHRTVHPAY